jgi:hypothetical protein
MDDMVAAVDKYLDVALAPKKTPATT